MSAAVAYIRDVFLGVFRRVGSVFKSVADWLRLAYSPCPYWRGNMLTVHADGKSPFQGQLRMVVSRVFQPTSWTVMEIAVVRQVGPPVRAVLKVFDRRFSPCARDGSLGEACPPGDWSPELEEELVDFVSRGAADDWVEFRQSEDSSLGDKRNKLQEEVDRQIKCEASVTAELTRLQSHVDGEKGVRKPKVYATIHIALHGEVRSEWLTVRGILMEYVASFSS